MVECAWGRPDLPGDLPHGTRRSRTCMPQHFHGPLPSLRRRPGTLVAACVMTLAVVACEDGSTPFAPTSPSQATGSSVAMAAWTPGTLDTCSQEIHDRYTVIGPDGLLYPTWHPPVDPLTGCSFGHEHGRDPRGSRLHRAVGEIPFGYANSQLDIWDPFGRRHEDHVGHKIEWQNDVPLRFGGGPVRRSWRFAATS